MEAVLRRPASLNSCRNRDDREAVKLLEDAAIKAHPKAQYNLARRLLTGEGVEKNEHRARILLMAAADAGERKAARILRVLKHKEPPPVGKIRRATFGGEKEKGVVNLAVPPVEADVKPQGKDKAKLRPTEKAVARAKAAAERRRSRAALPEISMQPAPAEGLGPGPARRRATAGAVPVPEIEAEAGHGRRGSLWVDLRGVRPEVGHEGAVELEDGDAPAEEDSDEDPGQGYDHY